MVGERGLRSYIQCDQSIIDWHASNVGTVWEEDDGDD